MTKKYSPVFIGMHKDDVLRICSERKIPFRVLFENGVRYKLTSDYHSHRANLVIVNEVITSCNFY